jgi:hypothetical protein
MSKLRSVSTAFWSDPFIEDLSANEKLLFLYFITNDKTNMLGIYEVSIKKISFDTGLNSEIINSSLKKFELLCKVRYVNNHIILVNYIKHQKFNPNMKKSAVDVYNSLPEDIKILGINTLEKTEQGFETLCKGFGMVRKDEAKVETKDEAKDKDEIEIFNVLDLEIFEAEIIEYSFTDFWELYPNKTNKKLAEVKFNKLTKEQKNLVEYHLPLFVANKPFKEYNYPHATTYLNQDRYKDEITTNLKTQENERLKQISTMLRSDGSAKYL